MNEADTRAEYIDKQLHAAGWSTGGDVRVQLDVQAAQALQAIKELL
jgi:type I site-specific restriction endonuclease